MSIFDGVATRIVKAGEALKKIKTAQDIGQSNARIMEVYSNRNAISFSGQYETKTFIVLFEAEEGSYPLIQCEGNAYRNEVPMPVEEFRSYNEGVYELTCGELSNESYWLRQKGYNLDNGKYAFASISIRMTSAVSNYRVDLIVKATTSGLVRIMEMNG